MQSRHACWEILGAAFAAAGLSVPVFLNGLFFILVFAVGLGLLPVEVSFADEKITAQTTYSWGVHEVHGYEIHHGVCTRVGQAEPFLDGWQVGSTFGTMLHGSLENDDFRNAFLTEVARLAGVGWRPDPDAVGYAAAREQMIEHLQRHLAHGPLRHP